MSEPIQAISQGNYILATQQEVSHDNTLSGNGTVDSPLGVLPGYNETVLWSGTAFTPAVSNNPMNGTAYLSESIFNFDQIRFDFSADNYIFTESVSLTNPIKTGQTCYFNVKKEPNNNNVYIGTKYGFTNDTTLTGFCSYGSTQSVNCMTGGYWGYGGVIRVIGINRKA